MYFRPNFLRSRFAPATSRRGAILPLAALLIVVMLGMIAFAIDIGSILTLRTQLQSAVDAGTLAAGASLGRNQAEAERLAREYVNLNRVGAESIPAANIQVELGEWNTGTREFALNPTSPSAIRVVAKAVDRPFFFAKIFGQQMFDVQAQATANFRPRDTMLVIDLSGSMSYDSQLDRSNLPQSDVEIGLGTMWSELGSPTYGKMKFAPKHISSGNVNSVINSLGLKKVPYPYPQGSWNDYIKYVMTSTNIKKAGYQKDYGYLTLMNYWLDVQAAANRTPDLWKVSAQPITAVKDAVKVFLSEYQDIQTKDRVGLAIYATTSRLEIGLTRDVQSIEDALRQRQAGHYDSSTNIGAGISVARQELEMNAQKGASKLMILLTDGLANQPYNAVYAKTYALQEADRCQKAGIPVITISLGSGADPSLMQQIADDTGGAHFNIPGGKSVKNYEEQLKKVFSFIAAGRALQLVD
jgi:Mg-chelatase subunit ChlD